MTRLRRILLAVLVLGNFGLIFYLCSRLHSAERKATAAIAETQKGILTGAGATPAAPVPKIKSDQIGSPRLQAQAKKAEASGAAISSRETGETVPVVFIGPELAPEPEADGTLRCPPFRFRVSHAWERVGYTDALAREYVDIAGTYSVQQLDADGSAIGAPQTKPFTAARLRIENAPVPAAGKDARRLFGLDLRVMLPDPSALVLAEYSPKSWAVSGRWAEGRFKLVGGAEIPLVGGGYRVAGGVGFNGGAGKR